MLSILVRSCALMLTVIAFSVGLGRDSQASESLLNHVRLEGQVMDGRLLGTPEGESLIIPNDLAPVAGATVEISSLGMNVETNEKGIFVIDPVAFSGSILEVDLDVKAAGFGDWRMENYQIRAGVGDNQPYAQLSVEPQIIQFPPFDPPKRTEDTQSPNEPEIVASIGGCTGFYSNTTQPSTIRVYRTSLGYWETYDFKTYVKNVLPREWHDSGDPWHPQSLRAGAISVENYGWYWVNNQKWPNLPNGTCYDVRDSTDDQVFIPGSQAAAYDQAVDAVWSSRAKKNGVIFQTNYWSGNLGESCGYGLNGWQSRQYGTKACAEAGYKWQDIVTKYYYPDVCVTPWTRSVPAGDADCDGFTTSREIALGSGPYNACDGVVPGVPSLHWPPDLVASNSVNIADVTAMKQFYAPQYAPYNPRYDLAGGGSINIADVTEIKPAFNTGCSGISSSWPAQQALDGGGEGSPGAPEDSGMSDVTVAMDANPFATSANTATSLGTREECVGAIVGNNVSIDVTVSSIPGVDDEGGGLTGFQFTLAYNASLVQVTGVDHAMLLSANGGSLVPFTDPLPDSDGTLVVAVGDFSTSPPESGDGVLVRITLKALAGGIASLDLVDVILVDSQGTEYAIEEVLNGCLEIEAS